MVLEGSGLLEQLIKVLYYTLILAQMNIANTNVRKYIFVGISEIENKM